MTCKVPTLVLSHVLDAFRQLGLLLVLSLLAGCSTHIAKDEPKLSSAEEVLKRVDNVALGEPVSSETTENQTVTLPDLAPKDKPSASNETNNIPLPTFKDMLSKKTFLLPSTSLETGANPEMADKQAATVASHTADITHLPPLRLVKASGSYKVFYLNAGYKAAGSPVSKHPIWREITTGYQLAAHTHRPAVQKEIQRLVQKPHIFKAASQKAHRYLPYILQEVREHRLPTEIALLPFVESGFSLTARSHANAAGLWQFIPETGRRYGLIQNTYHDQRLNLHHSTQAAINYLRDLHQRFNGDWLLALAAYNVGEGRVEREIRKNRSMGRATDFWSLDLPRETREYVPRLLAYRNVIGRVAYQGI